MTDQELFDKVARHLLTQGEKSVRVLSASSKPHYVVW